MNNLIKITPEQKQNIEHAKKIVIEKVRAVIIGLVIGLVLLFFLNIFFNSFKFVFQSPILIKFQVPILIERRTTTMKKIIKPLSIKKEKKVLGGIVVEGKTWTGTSSFYTTGKGCMGCSTNEIKANGEKLNDNEMIIAFNQLPLNSKVEVCNTQNGECAMAVVEDTGGFEKADCPKCCNGKGCIADLTLAVRNAIGSKGNTEVKITEILN